MKSYDSKPALIAEIRKRAELFIAEFEGISEDQLGLLVEGVDRSPVQMIAYQLGWMDLLLGWEIGERAGRDVVTPAPGYKWNRLGGLYESFYQTWSHNSLGELRAAFNERVERIISLIDSLNEIELFESGQRQWASSTPSAWPVWKWIHINTVAPFTTFRTKIRKWKRLAVTGS